MKRYNIVYKSTKDSPEQTFKIYANYLGEAEYKAFDLLHTNSVYYLDGHLIKSYSRFHK